MMNVLAIDLGGTAIKYGVVSAQAEIITQRSVATKNTEGALAVVDQIVGCVHEIQSEFKSLEPTIGLAFPSVVHNGVTFNCPNIPGFHEFDLVKALGQRCTATFVIENDANAAAWAEATVGVGLTDFLYVTLGTGIGGGIIRNGRIERGPRGDAGEVGHVFVDGVVVEQLVGAPALRNAAGGRDVHEIDAAANEGDRFSIDLLRDRGEILGRALCSALAVLGMSDVVVGGGVSASTTLVNAVRDTIRTRAIPSIAARATVTRARFNEHTGLVGAAMIVHNPTSEVRQ